MGHSSPGGTDPHHFGIVEMNAVGVPDVPLEPASSSTTSSGRAPKRLRQSRSSRAFRRDECEVEDRAGEQGWLIPS